MEVFNNTQDDVSIEETVNLVKIGPKQKQEIETRLKIVPETSYFLKQNLPEMQDVWKKSDDACWKMYFDIKE